ncbi:MAG: hypothetical protein J7464_04530 [Chloroflexus sp.]|jgi:hypothetical protein|nr:hypothetical protein [Chloroflexus sp.]
MKQPDTLDTYLNSHWQGFLSTYGALQMFVEEMTRRADQFDEKRLQTMAEELAIALDDETPAIRNSLCEFLPTDKDHILRNVIDTPNGREIINMFNDSSLVQQLEHWLKEHPQRSSRLQEILAELLYRPPVIGIYLRQSTLIALVSAVEVLIDALLFGYGWYNDQQYQSISNPDEKERTIEEHYQLRSWAKRWRKLEEVVSSDRWQKWKDEWQEIIARRNVCIHRGGRIDNQYLQQAGTYAPEQAQAERILLVPTQYLQRAMNVALMLAFTITQAAWRQWSKHHKLADKAVHDLTYELLCQRRFRLVTEMADFVESIGKERQPYVIVNLAIAFREQGRTVEMDRILGTLNTIYSRKQLPLIFQIALYILHEDYDNARHLMQNTRKEYLYRESVRPQWPLFDPIRDKPWFRALFHSR